MFAPITQEPRALGAGTLSNSHCRTPQRRSICAQFIRTTSITPGLPPMLSKIGKGFTAPPASSRTGASCSSGSRKQRLRFLRVEQPAAVCLRDQHSLARREWSGQAHRDGIPDAWLPAWIAALRLVTFQNPSCSSWAWQSSNAEGAAPDRPCSGASVE
jgi:hypothetical protein